MRKFGNGTEETLCGKVCSVTSISFSYGSQSTTCTYDAFGTLIQGDLTGTTDFGYLGKQHDPTAALYNYGYRDYNSKQSRFTSQDPIRDGINWYAYCGGDPINFVDSDGLEGKFFGYLQRLLSFDNSSIGISTNNNNSKSLRVPNPQNLIEDVSINFVKNLDMNMALENEGSLIPSANYVQKTQNQNKEQKTVWGKASFIIDNGDISSLLEIGVFSISSELNRKSGPIYASLSLDVVNASVYSSITDEGVGFGVGANVASVSGKIGFQFGLFGYDIQANLGGSAGLTVGVEGKFDATSGIVFDYGAILRPRIEIKWSKEDK